MYRVNVCNIGGPQQTQRAEFSLRDTVFERPFLSQGITHAHQNAAFNLPGHGERIGHASCVKGRIDVGDASLRIQDSDIGRVSVSDMAFRMRFVGAECIGGFIRPWRLSFLWQHT